MSNIEAICADGLVLITPIPRDGANGLNADTLSLLADANDNADLIGKWHLGAPAYFGLIRGATGLFQLDSC